MTRRIVYIVTGTNSQRGGQKVSFRHVEALNELGFTAIVYTMSGEPVPDWFFHTTPIQTGGRLRDDDILVIPDDSLQVLERLANAPNRKIVFGQNHFSAASQGIGVLRSEYKERYSEFITCGHTTAAWVARYLPHRSIDIIPAFADERLFQPLQKQFIIACTPNKRPHEFTYIHQSVTTLAKGPIHWRWAAMSGWREPDVASMLGHASIFLSLSRLEGLGMTTLEAMACGCVPVGFLGIGGNEYATSQNGLWVGEDDCEECVRRVLDAMDMIETQPSLTALTLAASRRTAGYWSYKHFKARLGSFWSSLLA